MIANDLSDRSHRIEKMILILIQHDAVTIVQGGADGHLAERIPDGQILHPAVGFHCLNRNRQGPGNELQSGFVN